MFGQEYDVYQCTILETKYNGGNMTCICFNAIKGLIIYKSITLFNDVLNTPG